MERTVVDHTLMEIRQHGRKGFPLAVYEDDFAYFDQGCICWHWHEELQFSMVKDKEIEFDVAGKSFVLRPGDAIFINSQALHRIKPCKSMEGAIYSYIFKASFLEHDVMSEIFTEYIQPVLRNKELCLVLYRTHEEDSRCLTLLDEIRCGYFEKKYAYQLKVKTLIGELWFQMIKRLDLTQLGLSAKEQRDVERVKIAISYIAGHYMEKISLEKLAEITYISKSELCRCFGRVLKTTPVDYVIQYRIQEAAKLLAQTDDSVTKIAMETGFDSVGHLGRFFKKYMEMTPVEFRKRE